LLFFAVEVVLLRCVVVFVVLALAVFFVVVVFTVDDLLTQDVFFCADAANAQQKHKAMIRNFLG